MINDRQRRGGRITVVEGAMSTKGTKSTDVSANDLQLAIHNVVANLLTEFVPKIVALPAAERAQVVEAIRRGAVRGASEHGVPPAQLAEYLRQMADELDAVELRKPLGRRG